MCCCVRLVFYVIWLVCGCWGVMCYAAVVVFIVGLGLCFNCGGLVLHCCGFGFLGCASCLGFCGVFVMVVVC